MTRPTRARTFTYEGVDVDPRAGTLTCRYRSDDTAFCEVATFDETVDLSAPGVETASVLYLLLAGLSYYKTGAAHRVDLGDLALGPATTALLAAAIHDGLGEFAFRNELDLSDVELVGGAPLEAVPLSTPSRGALVPFGGGIDSIVTASSLEDVDAALFIVGPRHDPYEAIERPARQTGLPVVRSARRIDDAVRHGSEAWFNGHVPVTAIVSALAIVVAVAQGRTAIVMSNERSASVPNLAVDGREVNHQWSKSLACEDFLRGALAERFLVAPQYASALRDRSELWVASRFAQLPEYLGSFMSCNRAFRQDPAARAATWCGACDKCLFTDLVLSPFLDRATLEEVFEQQEPIGDPARTHGLEVLVGLADNPKPFECVGDADECATALVASANRVDRADQRHLLDLAGRLGSARPLEELLVPGGRTNWTAAGAARDLV